MEKTQNAKPVKSVFKSGKNTISKEQFTRKWIEMINRIEKDKAGT